MFPGAHRYDSIAAAAVSLVGSDAGGGAAAGGAAAGAAAASASPAAAARRAGGAAAPVTPAAAAAAAAAAPAAHEAPARAAAAAGGAPAAAAGGGAAGAEGDGGAAAKRPVGVNANGVLDGAWTLDELMAAVHRHEYADNAQRVTAAIAAGEHTFHPIITVQDVEVFMALLLLGAVSDRQGRNNWKDSGRGDDEERASVHPAVPLQEDEAGAPASCDPPDDHHPVIPAFRLD